MSIFDVFRVGKKKLKSEKPNKEKDSNDILKDITEPDSTDISDYLGSIVNFGLNLLPQERTLKEKIIAYRRVAFTPQVDEALDEIINTAVVRNDGKVLKLSLDDLDFKDNVKDKIHEEFETILNLLNFNNKASFLFKQWYIDGRQFIFSVPHKNPSDGIKTIKQLRSEDTHRIKKDGNYYFKYNFKLDNFRKYHFTQEKDSVFIPEDYVSYSYSGILDPEHKYFASYIEKAIKPYNQLNLLEDAAIVYRLTRAPEKRAFYIHTKKIPKKRSEDYIRKMIDRFRSKLTYDVVSGKVSKKNAAMAINEDFYLPVDADGNGHKVENINGGMQLGEITDILYFRKKLYKCLNVPLNRLDDESQQLSFGRNYELTMEELKFNKFIKTLRNAYQEILCDLLIKQLIYKKILLNEDEKEELKNNFKCIWSSDVYIEQIKKIENLQMQIELADSIQPYIGKYFSHEFIRSVIFNQSDDEQKEIDKKIKEEKKNKQYQSDSDEENY